MPIPAPLFLMLAWRKLTECNIADFLIHHKIHLQLLSEQLATFVWLSDFHHTHIYMISSRTQFIVYDILHDMCLFLLAKA